MEMTLFPTGDAPLMTETEHPRAKKRARHAGKKMKNPANDNGKPGEARPRQRRPILRLPQSKSGEPTP